MNMLRWLTVFAFLFAATGIAAAVESEGWAKRPTR